MQDIKDKINQIIKVQTIAFALFIKIAVHYLILQGCCFLRQLPDLLRIADQGFHIPSSALSPADMIHSILYGQVPAGDAHILKNRPEHCFLVLFVQNDKGGGILHHMEVLLQKTHTKAVKGGDSAKILIRQRTADPFLHFRRSLIGKGDTENVGGGNAQLIHQVQIPCRQCFCLSGTGTCHHPDIPFCSGGSLQLLRIQLLQIVHIHCLHFGMVEF